MSLPQTEALHDLAIGLDARPAAEIAEALLAGQIDAACRVRDAVPALGRAAEAMADTLRGGGRLYYVAAGSSGLMAAADAMELGGTYAIPAGQLRILMAGGLPRGVEMPGATEDDTDNLEADLADLSGDDLMVAVSASGTTPYTLRAAQIAVARGTTLVAMANVVGAPLLALATHAICLPTPPELVSGSTRLGAGTAQKIALNTLSTLMAVRLGHVHDGMMVNLHADNAKLRARAAAIVARIAGVDAEAACQALSRAEGKVKPAVLVALGMDLAAAHQRLRDSGENLRAALARQS